MNLTEGSREPSFEVVDLFDGFVTLEKRSATLGGFSPLRVAQACLPLLEGNAIGFQITVRREMAITSRIDGSIKFDEEMLSDLERRLRAARPILSTHAILDRAALEALSSSVCSTVGSLGSRTVTLFTGLLIRPRGGVVLRVSGSGNRRSRDLRVKEAFLAPGRFQPLFITVSIDKKATRLVGELATLIPLPETCEVVDLAGEDEGARPLVNAHLAFYDQTYFDTKRAGQTTRKYRSMIAKASPPDVVENAARARIVNFGPAFVDVAPHEAGIPTRLLVRNAITFRTRFDGLNVSLRYDVAELDRFAHSVRSAWQPWMTNDRHPGALLYLTKYFTPHPPGEPHFFVKPPALLGTEPGWSTLLEGIDGSDYDVLRGVVRTDSFHATPAVFQLTSTEEVRVGEGTPLLSLFPFPRDLEAAPYRSIAWSERGLS